MIIIIFSGILTTGILLRFSVTTLSLIACILVGIIESIVLASIIVKPKIRIVCQIGQIPHFIFPLFYALNLVVLQIFQGSYTSPQLLDWNKIPISGYLRLFSSLLVIFFLPGFAILRILFLCRTLLEKIVFSVITSLFFTIIVSALLGFSYIIMANLILLFFYFLFSWKYRDSRKLNFYLDFDIKEVPIIVAVALVIMLGVLSNYMNFQLFLGPDTWRHHGVALALLENNVPLGKYNFYHVLLASIFYLSGFPYINLWSILSLFSIILLLAAYLSFSSLLSFEGKKYVIIISFTIWSLFSGFGSLGYYLYTKSFPLNFISVVNAYLKSYMDIGYPFGFWIYIDGFWPQLIGFISFFSLIHIFLKETYNKRDIFLFLISFIVGLTTHFFEVSFFVILYVSFVLFYRKTSFSTEKLLTLTLSELLGFLISFTFAFVKLGRVMLFRGDILVLELLGATIVGLMFLLLPKISLNNVKNNFSTFFRNKISVRAILLSFLIFLISFIYILGLLEWFSRISTFDFWNYYPDTMPWYIYPVRLGITGMLSIIALKKVLKCNGEKVSFLLYSILLTLTFSKIVGLPLARKLSAVLTSINETRILFLSFPFISVLAGIGFSEFVSFLIDKGKKHKLCKLLTISIITAFVFLLGMASTIQTIDFWALHNRNISREEILDLDYIRLNLNAKGLNPIIAPSYESFQLLQAFSGKFIDLETWSLVERAFAAKTQQEFVASLSLIGNPQYIYLAKRDVDLINNKFKGSFIGELLKNSTPVYSSDMVKIYRIVIKHYESKKH